MTKEELIAKQQIKIEEYKEMINENIKLKKNLKNMFYSVGEPLNDNKLQFNKEQLMWCLKVIKSIDLLN